MLFHLCGVVLVLIVVPGARPPQSEVKKASAGTGEMEVRFHDGSNLRMVALQDNLDVVTKYGKLTVPTSDIRQIEFGMHLADGLGEKITELTRDLGSKAFARREEASKLLLTYGAKALPALTRAAKSPDLEVAQRAQALIRQVREKSSAEELRAREDDTVVTKEFTIVGRVVTPILKARTKYFGDLEVKLNQVRGIRVSGLSTTVEVEIDAAKYGTREGTWLESSVEVNAGHALTITASGEVDLRPIVGIAGQMMCGPAGAANIVVARGSTRLPGALLGRIGESGHVFVIGERYQGVPTETGKLYLQIAPSPYANGSSGSYKVKIESGGSVP